MKYEFKLFSSLEKIFFKIPEHIPSYTKGSMLKNELYSFQLAMWVSQCIENRYYYKLEINSELKDFIKVYKVGFVPSIVNCITSNCDENYITTEPGIFPDPLYELEGDKVELFSNQARTLWFTVDAPGKSGVFPINIKLRDDEDNVICDVTHTLTVIDANLPKQTLYNTGWFHGDCIAVLHNVEILSDEYFELVRDYLKVYVKFGHNMILTPIFTPPLDTAVGTERPTNQLIDVFVNDGEYSFKFDKLFRWIDVCKDCGIEYFEISHLFTQWGAKFAPKVMATVDGEYKRIFGWETEAMSEEYQSFIDIMLGELTKALKSARVYEKCWFHVSDEPNDKNLEQYKHTKGVMLKYISENRIIDALGNYTFYEKGVITKPVVGLNYMTPFLDNNAKNIWGYYCVSQGKGVSNRFMAMPSYRNRILGVQLYKNNIEGFLQWGFNFWFSQYSKKVINPFADTNADGAFPGGDPFVVYPKVDGKIVCSLRLYVFYEALQDLRALQLLEELTDRKTVDELLCDIYRFETYPKSSDYLINLRQKINEKIAELI